MEISARHGKNEPVKSVFNMPGTVAEKIKAWGEDVVNAASEDSVIITIQALSRRLQKAGKSVAEINKAVADFKPNVRTLIRQSAFEKASSSLDKLTPEERKALLAKLQALR